MPKMVKLPVTDLSMSAVLKVAVMGKRASAILARVVVVAIFALALAIQALVPISMAVGGSLCLNFMLPCEFHLQR